MLSRPVIKRKDQIKERDQYDFDIVENADSWTTVITGGKGAKRRYEAETFAQALKNAQEIMVSTSSDPNFGQRDVMIYAVRGTLQALVGTWSRKFGWKPCHARYDRLRQS